MAASAGDAHPFPIYNARYRVVFPLLDADGDPVSPSSPDSEVSQDQGTFADATNEATEIATASGICYLDLTAGEMDTKCTTVRVQSTGAKTTPLVLYPVRLPVIRTGTAQAGAASTITLDSSASAIDDFYNGCWVNITNNSPANAQGQARLITDYVGSTKVATVEAVWGTNPSSASTFEILLPTTAGVAAWAGTAVADPHAIGYPVVTIKDGTGTGEIDTTSGGVLVAAIANNAITANAIASDAITAAKIATGAIDADAIADNAIDAGAIAADAITAAKIADGAIDAATFAAGAINAAAIATDAITAAKIAADAIGASELAADAVAEIQSGLATAAALDAVDNFVDTEIAAIISTLGTPAGASLAADIAAIEAQTDDLGVAGAGLTAVPWNPAWDAEVQSEVEDALVAHRLDELLNADSDIDGAAPPTVGSVFHELMTKATGSFTYDQTTDSLEALADSGGGGLTAQQVADAVWDEPLASHLDSGSTGEALNAAGSAGDPWVTALPGAYGAGSAGFIVGTNLNATVSSRATQASVDTIDGIVDDILADTAVIGSPAGASLADDIAAIEAQTDDIGAGGAGLTAIPWNAAWDAEVQSEVADALGVYDPPTHAELVSEIDAVQADVAGVQSDTNDIQTRLPVALVAGRMSSDAVAISGSTAAADAVEANIGNLNATVSSRASQTSVDDLPTNSELATALAAADDAVLAAIAALENLSAAEVTAAVPSAANIASTLIATALSELAQAQPAATPTVGQALMLPYMMLRNGGAMDKDSGISTYKNDAGTVVFKRTLSDDGSVLTEGELVAGP